MSWPSPHEVRQRYGDDDDDLPLSDRSFFSYPSGGCDYSSGGGGAMARIAARRRVLTRARYSCRLRGCFGVESQLAE
jgi:hypothetical protein